MWTDHTTRPWFTVSFIKCLLNAIYAQGALGSAGINLSPCHYFRVEMMNGSCKHSALK